jgi:hypothetical protein
MGVILALLGAGGVDLFAPALVRGMMAETGFPPDRASALGGFILICALLYAIPATAMLGAILITAFLGGAIATHVRLEEIGSLPQWISLALGMMTWGGLYLRDARMRTLLPFTSRSARFY